VSSDLRVKVVHVTPPIPIPDWLREDLGLPPAEPEPTPVEKALAILAPHLDAEPLYQPPSPTT
jgi:transposase